MGKHSGRSEEGTAIQKMLDFDAAQAEIDARVEENKTDYPALQNYEEQKGQK